MKLGDYFYKGIYEEPNYVRAVRYYTKSLKAELIPSMKGHIYFNLGLMHALGLGLPENRTKAYEMFE
jgi:TPR repeat protein